MREAFISILAILALSTPSARCSELGKDGFNYYKDYLRGRSDDATPEGPAAAERMLYFYRTPMQLNPGLLPVLEQEYRKRTGNAFKNHMLSKEMWAESEPPSKRSSKAALSFLMQGKHRPYHTVEMDDNMDVLVD